MNRKGSSRYSGLKKGDSKAKVKISNNPSVHRRNLRIVSLPLLLLFSLLRAIAFQLWLAISAGLSASRRILTRRKSTTDAEVVTAMSGRTTHRASVMTGEPTLNKQKQHHRNAFEHISKALKIDEEDSGNESRSKGDNAFINMPSYYSINVIYIIRSY